jgi:hypothetical protein
MQKIKDWFNNVFLPLWKGIWQHPVILWVVKAAKWFWNFLGSEELSVTFPMAVFFLWWIFTKDFFAAVALVIQGLILLKMVIAKCKK